MKDGVSWAMGTHEYRPMGVAVISSTDYFRARDFQAGRGLPSRERDAFVGFFASLGDMNARMRGGGKRRGKRRGIDLL